MGRTSNKRRGHPSPTSSNEDGDYVPDFNEALDSGAEEQVEEQAEEQVDEDIEEENEAENDEEEEEEEENEEEEDELDYDPHRFRSKDAQDYFDSYWSKRAILCERGINLNHFQEEPVNFKAIMNARGWCKAVTFRDTADPTLVREFYANAVVEEDEESGKLYITSMVRGRHITIHRRRFRSTFTVPKVSRPGYPYPDGQEPPLPVLARHLSEGETRSWGVRRQFPKNKLSTNFRILHELICSQILPVSHDDFVSPDRAMLMYALTTGVSVDLASLVTTALRIRIQQNKVTNSLPFAGFIMRLLEKRRVPIDANFRTARPLAMLSSSTSARSLGQTHHRRGAGHTSTASTSASAPPTMPPVMPTVRMELQALGGRLTAIEAEQRVQGARLTAMEAEQRTHRGLLESILAAVRPPPPPADDPDPSSAI